MSKKLIVSLSVVVLIVVFALAVNFYKRSESERLGFIAQDNSQLFMRDYSPVWGDPNAKVVVTEFMDPECESCRAFYPYVKELLQRYEGKAKLVIRYVPYHGNSRLVIKVLEAARRQNKYWETLETLFHFQPQWGDHHNPRPELIWTFLQQIQGLDIDRLKNDMNDPAFEKIIAQDMQDAEQLGVRGTPTFYVNGKEPERFGLEYVQKLIEQELAK